MFGETTYTLPMAFAANGDGTVVKGQPSGGGTGASFYPSPLGASYIDQYRKDRQLSPALLIQQLVGICYTCANLNSNGVAGNRLRLYVKTGANDKKTRWPTRPLKAKNYRRLVEAKAIDQQMIDGDAVEEITSHPLLDCLDPYHGADEDDEGQPVLSLHDMLWCTQMYLETLGRAYWLIKDRDALGTPKSLWLLRSHMVVEVPDYSLRKVLLCYQYGGASGYRYDPKDVIKFSVQDMNLLYLGGYSPTIAAMEEIRITRQLNAQTNAMLENMGRPDAIWSPKGDDSGPLGPAEARRMQSAIRQQFGEAGRGGVLVSEYAGALQPLQWAPQDVVEITRMNAMRTNIAAIYDVPDTIINRNFSNLASAKTGDYAHQRYGVMPRCNRIAGALERLCRIFDPTGRLFVAFDSSIPDDEVFALEQVKAATAIGAVTRNEIRAAIDLEPVVWAQLPLCPNTMVSVDPATGKPDPPATAASAPGSLTGAVNPAPNTEPDTGKHLKKTGLSPADTGKVLKIFGLSPADDKAA